MHFLDVNLEHKNDASNVICRLIESSDYIIYLLDKRTMKEKKSKISSSLSSAKAIILSEQKEKENFFSVRSRFFPPDTSNDQTIVSELSIFSSICFIDRCRLVYKLRSVNLFSRLEHIQCDKYNERRFSSIIHFHTYLKGRTNRNERLADRLHKNMLFVINHDLAVPTKCKQMFLLTSLTPLPSVRDSTETNRYSN